MDLPAGDLMVHWTWGLSTAVLLAVVIWLNGRQVRAGWLLGAAVQLVNVTFGWLIYGQWTFLFLLIPAGLFLWNWRQHPKRVAMPTGIIAAQREITTEEFEALKARWDQAHKRQGPG